MRLLIIFAVLALAACTNPNPNTPEIVAYNERILQTWGIVIGSILVPLVTAIIAYLANKNAKAATENVQRLSQKVDDQQSELIDKADNQTRVIVAKTEKAVEKVAQMQPVDDGRRDRREGDKLGGI